MKLVIAIVQDDDASDLVEVITDKNFRVTKLATTGGFLKSGNTTLLIGGEKEKVDEVLAIIKDVCKSRKQCSNITFTSSRIHRSIYAISYRSGCRWSKRICS